MSVYSNQVILDDTDPRIKYEGPWISTTNQTTDIWDQGYVYNGTLRGAGPGAKLTFTFEGTGYAIQGVIDSVNKSGVYSPRWRCIVDHDVSIMYDGDESGSSWNFCSTSSMQDGNHTIEMETETDDGVRLWVDLIRYNASSTANLANEVVRVKYNNIGISYTGGWRDFQTQNGAKITSTQGDKLKLDFSGTAITWKGIVPRSTVEKPPTTGTYVIDNQPPVNFTVPFTPSNNWTIFDPEYFKIENLKPALHHLEVTYNGNPSTTPLVLYYFHIQNSTVPDSERKDGGSPPDSNRKSKPSPGVIVGGIIVALAVVAFIIFLVLFLRKRKRQKWGTPDSEGNRKFLFSFLPQRWRRRQQVGERVALEDYEDTDDVGKTVQHHHDSPPSELSSLPVFVGETQHPSQADGRDSVHPDPFHDSFQSPTAYDGLAETRPLVVNSVPPRRPFRATSL